MGTQRRCVRSSRVSRLVIGLTHVLTHTGIGNNGDISTKWIYDLRVLRKSGLKRAKKHRISRNFRSELSS